jgi:hypothetical protein
MQKPEAEELCGQVFGLSLVVAGNLQVKTAKFAACNVTPLLQCDS